MTNPKLPVEPTTPSQGNDESVAGEEDPGASLDQPGQADKPFADVATLPPGGEVLPGTSGTGEVLCRACGGGGRLGDMPCPACGGTGKVTVGFDGG